MATHKSKQGGTARAPIEPLVIAGASIISSRTGGGTLILNGSITKATATCPDPNLGVG